MLARRLLSLRVVLVGYANDFEAGLFVGREMRVVHDSTSSNDSDPLVEFARQLRFVIQMGKHVSHVNLLLR